MSITISSVLYPAKKISAYSNSVNKEGKETSERFNLSATSSAGVILKEQLEEQQNIQKKNGGYNIFSVSISEKIATVTYEAIKECELLVGIYSQDGKKMIASGKELVNAENTSADITIDVDEMPEYFFIKAYLIEENTYHPLCSAYSTPIYTKEMQEFLEKDINDFETDRVLNLDNNEENNFAVYNENTKVIIEKENINEMVSVDEEEQKYVIKNIDSEITTLTKGDTFAYKFINGEVVIANVGEITISDSTATIIGQDTSMEDAFDYVKVDAESDVSEAEIDSSNMEEGITYEENIQKKGVKKASEITGSTGVSASFGLDKKFGKCTVVGQANFSAKNTVKIYLSLSYQYVELRLDTSIALQTSISGAISKKIPLAKFSFIPVPGVILSITPSIVFQASAKIEVNGTLSSSVGFSADRDEGIQNLSSTPKFKTEVKVTGTFFIGLSLEPEIKLINEKLAAVALNAKVGCEIKGEKSFNEENSDKEKHVCTNCIKGSTNAKLDLSFKVDFVELIHLKKDFLNLSYKLWDWYYSVDFGEFAFTTCPHKQYRITVVALNPNGNPIKGVTINNSYKTDANGSVSLWLSDGMHTLNGVKGNIESVSKKITVHGSGKRIILNFKTNTDVNGVEESETNPLIDKKIKSVSVNRYNCGIVTTDGDLYTWGYNNFNQLGTEAYCHRVPKKILSNVAEVQMLDCGPGAALTTNGDLYIWGSSSWVGSDEYNFHYPTNPTKILGNVKKFKMDGFGSLICYALTNSGELYLWGTEEQYGNRYLLKNSPDITKPYKVMEQVVSADIYQVDSTGWYECNVCCAVKENGELYLWGGNTNGVLGDLGREDDGEGDYIGSAIPLKRLENVKSAKLGENCCMALSESNDLYIWGRNWSGEVGNGTTDKVYEPQKVLSNISSYDIAGHSVVAVSTKNEMYVWGYDLTETEETGEILTPTKLLDNVEEARLGTYCGVAKMTAGGWYMWGDRAYSYAAETYSPYKCPLKNVKIIDVSCGTISAINTKNDLYMWGHGFWQDQLDYWGNSAKHEPVKINADISSFEITQPIDSYSIKKQKIQNYNLSDDISNFAPNEIYNIYVLEDDEKEWLSDENLLYINQCVSDSEGKIDLEYTTKKEVDGEPYVYAVKLNKVNIEDCTIDIVDSVYEGNTDLVQVNVSYNGKKLVEGTDYELSGNVEIEKPGTYSITIEGQGDYTGQVEKTYEVSCDHCYSNWVVIKKPTKTEEGTQKGTCIYCGQEFVSSIAKLTSNVSESEKQSGKGSEKSAVNVTKKIRKPSKCKLINAKNLKSKKIKISWKKISSVAGYQIQYALNKKFKKKKSKTTKQNKCILKKLKKKTYYIRVRAYKLNGKKKVYGTWSKVKKVKVKQ